MDNALNLKAPWAEVKEKLKENDISLTDEDLRFEKGRESDLLTHLAGKMKKSVDEVRAYIESISENTAKSG